MATLTKTLWVDDSVMIPGDQNGTPLGLARVAAAIADLGEVFPAGTRDIDFSTLTVRVENGELVVLSISTRPRPVQ